MEYENKNSDGSSTAASGINTPDLSSRAKPRARAIKDEYQASCIVKELVEENRERNVKGARIMAKYNAEAPFKRAELDADGLGWKNNFSTKPLGILIDKISPRFSKAVQGVKYLTSSALPDSVAGAERKTDVFRQEITATVRARKAWKNFINELAQENALFGFTAVAWTDEYTWMPRHYRQDEFFLPRGTKQNSEQCQLLVLKDTFLIHELFSLIEDIPAADSAGWNVENTINAINKAAPDSIRSNFSEYIRVYEDLAREMNTAVAHHSGAKVISCYHILATEVSGKVSHWIISGEMGSMKLLFQRDDRFDSMADASSFFAFAQGNGTMHGSKGIGREVYSMAGMLDRARNEVVDRLQLSGKVIIRCDEKMIKRFRMSVMGNAVLIGSGYDIQQQKIDGNVEAFFTLDQYLTALLDQIAGTVSPKMLEGERVTKAAVDLVAGREEERRDVIIERFLSQFADMVSTIQRRLCDPKTTDTDAKQMQERLLKVMPREELDQLAKLPAASTVADFTDMERQRIALICQEARGNPLYNQKAVEHAKLTALMSADFANQLLLPDNDPGEEAEQSREQLMENSLILDGRAVGVSPRDNHRIHLDNLYPVIEATVKALIDDPGAIQTLKVVLEHGNAHVQLGMQSAPDAFKEDEAKFKNFIAVAKQVEEHLQKAEAASPEALAASAIPDNGAPPGSPAMVPGMPVA